MQLGGGATSCRHFDGGFIGGEQPYQQIPQGNQIPDGRRDARPHDEVDLGLSLKQWLRPRPWVGKRDDSAITYPVNIHWAVANQLWHHLRIVYFWLRRTVRHTECMARPRSASGFLRVSLDQSALMYPAPEHSLWP
jgi:hypothetical protein